MSGSALLRVSSVGIRSLLIVAMAIWLQPAELGLYAIVAATLTLTTYFYGLDFQTHSMRELSTTDLRAARSQVRDQLAMLLLIYLVGGTIVVFALLQFGLKPALIALVVPTSIVQHLALEFYRILSRLGRVVSGTAVLFVRDSAWVPLCLAMKVATGTITLTGIMTYWLAGSVLSVAFGGWLLARVLPATERRAIDIAWLVQGLQTGLRMLVGTLSLVGLFNVDRMIFAKLATPDQLGAYAFFSMGCTAIQGLFETAILPTFWAPLLQAHKEGDNAAALRAQRELRRICVLGAIAGALVTTVGVSVLAHLLPHRAYADNLGMLGYLVAAYALLTLTNIPHYRLFAAREDASIVRSNLAAFLFFLLTIALLVRIDRVNAVPMALAASCALLLLLKWEASRRAAVANLMAAD